MQYPDCSAYEDTPILYPDDNAVALAAKQLVQVWLQHLLPASAVSCSDTCDCLTFPLLFGSVLLYKLCWQFCLTRLPVPQEAAEHNTASASGVVDESAAIHKVAPGKLQQPTAQPSSVVHLLARAGPVQQAIHPGQVCQILNVIIYVLHGTAFLLGASEQGISTNVDAGWGQGLQREPDR